MLIDAHVTGAGLGLGLTPRAATTGTGFTPLGMQITPSQAGISAAVAALDAEEERRRRLDVIVGMVGGRWGVVSREGVERAAGRLGLETLWDDYRRMLTVAGTGVLVDVLFEEGEGVRAVKVAFEGSGGGVERGREGVERLLVGGLRGVDDGKMGYMSLEGFVGNLERLAAMDRLGGGGVSAFDAVDGVGESLRRVWGWELERAGGRRTADLEVLCGQSGRPVMHGMKRVGLSLQYWMERRWLSQREEDPSSEAMDIDSGSPPIDHDTDSNDDSTIWSALIECEASPADLYPPIRISTAWVSPTVQKPPPSDSTTLPLDSSPLDWQDPPPTYLSPPSLATTSNGNGANANAMIPLSPSNPKLPSIAFAAKFYPPIPVPLQLALAIHQSLAAPLAQEILLPTTYEQLVFAPLDTNTNTNTNTTNDNGTTSIPRTIERILRSYDPSTDSWRPPQRYRFTLFSPPQDYAREIAQLPFSHPRQIVELLPMLRQWALAAGVLRRTFGDGDEFAEDIDNDSDGDGEGNEAIALEENVSAAKMENRSAAAQSLDAELAAFMAEPSPLAPPLASSSAKHPAARADVKAVEITLTTAPLPRMVAHFPSESGSAGEKGPRGEVKVASLGFNVGVGGRVEGVDVDTSASDDGVDGDVGDATKGNGEEDRRQKHEKLKERLQRVLEISEDIGVGVEWMLRAS